MERIAIPAIIPRKRGGLQTASAEHGSVHPQRSEEAGLDRAFYGISRCGFGNQAQDIVFGIAVLVFSLTCDGMGVDNIEDFSRRPGFVRLQRQIKSKFRGLMVEKAAGVMQQHGDGDGVAAYHLMTWQPLVHGIAQAEPAFIHQAHDQCRGEDFGGTGDAHLQVGGHGLPRGQVRLAGCPDPDTVLVLQRQDHPRQPGWAHRPIQQGLKSATQGMGRISPRGGAIKGQSQNYPEA